MNENDKKKKRKKGGLINSIMDGRIFASKIITNNAWLLALIVVYSFIYVSNRYEYEKELLKIYRLTKTRDELRNNLLTLKSEFSYQSRQTEIESFLKENDSKVKAPTRPNYIIYKD